MFDILKKIWNFLKKVFNEGDKNNNITKIKNKGNNNIVINGNNNSVNADKKENENEN